MSKINQHQLCGRNPEYSHFDELTGYEKSSIKRRLWYKRKKANKKLKIDKALNEYIKLRSDIERFCERLKEN